LADGASVRKYAGQDEIHAIVKAESIPALPRIAIGFLIVFSDIYGHPTFYRLGGQRLRIDRFVQRAFCEPNGTPVCASCLPCSTLDFGISRARNEIELRGSASEYL
jgi:hypothetical protein